MPKFEDVEKSFDDLQQRLVRVTEFVKSISPTQIDGSEDREITLPIGGQSMSFKGQTYLLHFALPNFYFHLTTAYAILRHNGVGIGKRDFIGAIS